LVRYGFEAFADALDVPGALEMAGFHELPAAPGTLKVQPIEGELTDAELKQMTNEQLKELIERGQDRR